MARAAWSRELLRAKAKALAAHLSISAVLVAIAFALILRVWFPQPLFITDGADQGIKLIVLVDMVLGPLLTFVVFNPAKKRRELLLDLSLIAAAQLTAYAGGLWSIHTVRIQAVAFHEGSFHTVPANTFKNQTITAAEWRALGAGEPYLVTVREPANAEESTGVLAFGLTEGLMPWQLQFLYQPFAKQSARDVTAGYRWAELQAANPAVAKAASDWAGSAARAQALLYYPVEGYSERAVLAFDAKGQWQGGFAGKLDAKPQPAGDAPATSPAKPRPSRRFLPQASEPAKKATPSSG